MPFARWEAATHCVGSAQPGARALMKWCLTEYPAAYNLGLYSCRPVRGGAAMSGHAEGRAGDTGFPLVEGKANPAGHRLVQQLRPHAAELGVQAIIFDRRIWSAKSPGRAGRPYTGVHPHRDHVHWELTRRAASRLTLATIRHVLEPVTAADRPTLQQGDRGPAVRALQAALRVHVDGSFGPITEAALNRFKARHGLPRDGVAGHRVWDLLEGGS